jgi:hypothetical protein
VAKAGRRGGKGWCPEPPYPLAPHYVSTSEDGGELRVRILFAAEPDKEDETYMAKSRGMMRT